MRLNRTSSGAARAFPAGLFAALLFCALFAGCENYCVIINSNPGGTGNANPSCPATSTGTVGVTINSSVAADSALVRAPHIFVTLDGVDALPAPSFAGDSPAWQSFAPQLALDPVQVDLAAPAGASCATGALGSADVPAGVYRQLRLRIVSDSAPNTIASQIPAASATSAALPLESSACGADLVNCLIPPDGAPQPLVWDNPAEIVIQSSRIDGGSFRVSPATSIHLSIAFDPVSSRALPDASASTPNSLRLIPFLSAATHSCASPD